MSTRLKSITKVWIRRRFRKASMMCGVLEDDPPVDRGRCKTLPAQIHQPNSKDDFSRIDPHRPLKGREPSPNHLRVHARVPHPTSCALKNWPANNSPDRHRDHWPGSLPGLPKNRSEAVPSPAPATWQWNVHGQHLVRFATGRKAATQDIRAPEKRHPTSKRRSDWHRPF